MRSLVLAKRLHEHAWQEATGMEKDFETIEELLNNIFSNYDEY